MIRSQALRDSARGQQCTAQIVGVCNHNQWTTVLAHLPDESKGMSRKSDDFVGAFCCSNCHDMIDGRVKRTIPELELEWYMRRAQTRTLRRWVEMGLITIKGAK